MAEVVGLMVMEVEVIVVEVVEVVVAASGAEVGAAFASGSTSK